MFAFSLPSTLFSQNSALYCPPLLQPSLPREQAKDIQQLLNQAQPSTTQEDPVLAHIEKRQQEEREKKQRAAERELYQNERADLEKFIESKKEDLAYSLYYGSGIDDQVRAMLDQTFEYLHDPKTQDIDWKSYRERFVSDEEVNERDWQGLDAYILKEDAGISNQVTYDLPNNLSLNNLNNAREIQKTTDRRQIYSRREDQIKHILAEKLLNPLGLAMSVQAGQLLSIYSLEDIIKLSFIKDYIRDFKITKNEVYGNKKEGKLEPLSSAEIDAKAREVFEFESKLQSAFDNFSLIQFSDWKDFQNRKPKLLEVINHIQHLAPGISFEDLGWKKNQDCSQAFDFPNDEVKAVSLKDFRAIRRHSRKMKTQDRLQSRDSKEFLKQLQALDSCLTKRSDKLKEELSINDSWTLPQLAALEFLYKRYGWNEAFFNVNGSPMTLGDFRALLQSEDPNYIKMTAQFLSSAQQMAGKEGLVLTIFGNDWKKYLAPSENAQRPSSLAVTTAAAQAEEVIEALLSYQLWARQNFDRLSLQTGVAQAPQRLKWVQDEFQKRLGSILTKHKVPRERWDLLRDQAAQINLDSLISEFPILETSYFFEPELKHESFAGRVYAQYLEQSKHSLQDYEMMFGRDGKDRDTQESTALSMEAAHRDAGIIYRSEVMRDGAFLQNFFGPLDKNGLHSFFIGEKAPAKLEKHPEEVDRMLKDLGLKEKGLIDENALRAMEMTGITWTPDFLKFLNRDGFVEIRNDYQNFSKALFEMGRSLISDFNSEKLGLHQEEFKKLIHLYLENPQMGDKTFAEILRTPSDLKNGGLIDRLLTNPFISIKEADAKDILYRAHLEKFWPEDKSTDSDKERQKNKDLRERVLDQLARLRVFLLATHSLMGSEASGGSALNDQLAFMQGSSLNQEIFNAKGVPSHIDQQLWMEDRLEKMWKSLDVLSYTQFDPYLLSSAFAEDLQVSHQDSFTPFFKSLQEVVELQLNHSDSAEIEQKIQNIRSALPKKLQESPVVLSFLHFIKDESIFNRLRESQIYDLRNIFKAQKEGTFKNRLNAIKGLLSSGLSGKEQIDSAAVAQFFLSRPGLSFSEFLKRARAVIEAKLKMASQSSENLSFIERALDSLDEKGAARAIGDQKILSEAEENFLKLFPKPMRDQIPEIQVLVSSFLNADYKKINLSLGAQSLTSQKERLDEVFRETLGEAEALNRRRLFTTELDQQSLISDRLAEVETIFKYVLGNDLGWDKAKLSQEILALQAEGKFDFDQFIVQLAVPLEYQAERQIEGTVFFNQAKELKPQVKAYLENMTQLLPEEWRSGPSELRKLLEDLSQDDLWKIQPEAYLGIRFSNLNFTLTGAPHFPKNFVDADALATKFKEDVEGAKTFLKNLGQLFSLQMKLNAASEADAKKIKLDLESFKTSIIAQLPKKLRSDSQMLSLVDALATPGILADYKDPQGYNPFQQTLLSVFQHTMAARNEEFNKERNKQATELISSLISNHRGSWFQDDIKILAPFSNASNLSEFQSKFLLNQSSPLIQGDPLLLREDMILSDLYGSEFKMILESFGPEYRNRVYKQAREIANSILDIETRLSSKDQNAGLSREDLKKIFQSQDKIEQKNDKARDSVLQNAENLGSLENLIKAFSKQKLENPLFEGGELTPEVLSKFLSQSGVSVSQKNMPQFKRLMESFQKAISISNALIQTRAQSAQVIQNQYSQRRSEQIDSLIRSLRSFSKTSERENLNPKEMFNKLEAWSNEKSKAIQETRRLSLLQVERSRLGLTGLPWWDKGIRSAGFFLKSAGQGAWGMTSGAGIDVARFVYNSGEAGQLLRLYWTATDQEFARGISQMGGLEEDPLTGKFSNDYRQTLSGFNRHLMSDESAFASHWAWYMASAALIGKGAAMARLKSLGLAEQTTSKLLTAATKERSVPLPRFLSPLKKPKLEIAAQAGVKTIQETNQILGKGARSLLASGKDLSLLKSTFSRMRNFALPRGGEFGKLVMESGLFAGLGIANKAAFSPKEMGMDPDHKLAFFGTGQFWLGTLPQEFFASMGFFLAMRYQSIGLGFVERGMPNLAFVNHYLGRAMSFHIYSMMGKAFAHWGTYKLTADPVDRKYDSKNHEWIYPNETEAMKGQELDAVTQEFWNQVGMAGIMTFTHNAHAVPEILGSTRRAFGAAPSRSGSNLANIWNYFYRRPEVYQEQTIQIIARDLARQLQRTKDDVREDPVEAYRIFMTTPGKDGMSPLEKNIRNALHGIQGQVSPSKVEIDKAIATFNTNFEIGVRMARDMQLVDSQTSTQQALDLKNLFRLKDPEFFVAEVQRRESRYKEIMKERERLGMPKREDLLPTIQNTSLNKWADLIEEVGFDPYYFKKEGSQLRADLFAQKNLSALSMQIQALRGVHDEIGVRNEIKSPDGKTLAYQNIWISTGDLKKYKEGESMTRDSLELQGSDYELRYQSAFSAPKVFQDGSIVFNAQSGDALMITPNKKVSYRGVGNQEVLSFGSLEEARNVFAKMNIQIFKDENLVTPLFSVPNASPVPIQIFVRDMKKSVQVSEFKPLTARISERVWTVQEDVSSNPLLRNSLFKSVRDEISGTQAGMRYPLSLTSEVRTRRYANSQTDGAEPVVYESMFRNSIRIDIKKGKKTHTLRLPAFNKARPYEIDIEKNLLYIDGPADLFLKVDLISEKFEMIDRLSGQVRVQGNLGLWEKVAERFTLRNGNVAELSTEELFNQLLSVRYKGMDEAVVARQEWTDHFFEINLKKESFKIYKNENGKRVDLLDGPMDIWEAFSKEVAKVDRKYVSDLDLHEVIARYIEFARRFSGAERMKYNEMEAAGDLPMQTYLPDMERAFLEQKLVKMGFVKQPDAKFVNLKWQNSENYKFTIDMQTGEFEISKKENNQYASLIQGKVSEWDSFFSDWNKKNTVMTAQGPRLAADFEQIAPEMLIYQFKEYREQAGSQ